MCRLRDFGDLDYDHHLIHDGEYYDPGDGP
jgi:hypothetical protein